MRLQFRRAAVLAAVFVCLLSAVPLGGSAQGLQQPDIVARRAIVVDASTGDILLDKGANEPAAMASLTKLFTAFVAIETTPLDRQMTINASDLVGEASMGLSAGEALSFQTLLNGMLLPSGNDAAAAIARNLGSQTGDSDDAAMQRFIERANARLAALGLHNTHLVNPHGLDADGHYSTARDIAALTLYALDHEPTFGATLQTAEYESEGHSITNTNRLLGSYDGLLGGKTGVTDNAGYCLMQVAERDGKRVIAVLLGSTPDAWYDDAEALLDYGFAASAVPGAATRFGQISFATAPAVAMPQTAGVDGLAVSPVGSGVALVSQTSVINAPRRSPWLWLVTAAVLAPASLLTLAQFQRGLRRRSTRPGHRPAAMVDWHAGSEVIYQEFNRGGYTPPADAFAQVTWDHVSPDYRFEETTEWQLPVARPITSRRPGRKRHAAFSPSYGGD